MGIYLNSTVAYTLYKNETVKPYFVDKTQILEELFPLVREGNNYICLTRPRRFGKTVMANMIAAFFSGACDAENVFESLHIAQADDYRKYLNQYQVIHISFNDLPKRCTTYEQYVGRIEQRLLMDLKQEYQGIEISEEDAVWDALSAIYAANPDIRFIFVLDEWDFVFHRDFVTEEDK